MKKKKTRGAEKTVNEMGGSTAPIRDIVGGGDSF